MACTADSCPPCDVSSIAPVAQLDRATGFEPVGRGFDSLRAHHISLAQHLLASVLALTFAVAPLAGAICEATCVDQAGHFGIPSADGPHHHRSDPVQSHAAHHHAWPEPERASTDVALDAAPGACAHLDGAVSEPRDLVRAQMARGMLIPAGFSPIAASRTFSIDADRRHGPPAPHRPSQLRV